MKYKSIFLLAIAILLGLVQSPRSSTFAQEVAGDPANRAIAFYPEATGEGTFVSIEVPSGSSATFRVVVGNAGDIEQTLRTYAAPADSAAHGGFVLLPYGTAPDAQTSWLDYPETTLTFAPGEGTVIDVTVEVPSDTPSGEYVTGLAAEQADPFEIEGNGQVDQRVRWAMPVLIVVPGDRNPEFSIDSATFEDRNGTLIANIGVTNIGNVTVRPSGQVRLLDDSGKVVGTSEIEMRSVYAGTDSHLIASWESVPNSKVYSIEVSLTAENGSVSVERIFENLVFEPELEVSETTPKPEPLIINGELISLTKDNPPSTLQFDGAITNNGTPIENSRISIVTYKDGVEVDRYPIMQAVTIEQGTTPVQARYSLPGGFTEGTYTFEVTIELGDAGTQTILVTQPIDFEIVVP